VIAVVKIGLIGCGRISENHFQAISQIPGAEIIGCCDIIEHRAKSVAHKYNIPFWTTSYEELLNLGEIDLVSICTPSGLHPKHGIMAANSGKHVLTEKPMAVSVESAMGLIDACNKNNVKLFVVLQNRLNPAIKLVKKAIDKKRFGRIFKIVSNVFWARPQEYYDMAPWRGTWKLDGGAFSNQASHYVDLVQWFGGPVHCVTAQTATLDRKIETEDTGSAIIRFRSGCIATINVTMLTYPKNLEGSITIIGEKGTVRIGGVAANEILHWDFSDDDEDDLKLESASTHVSSVYGFGHMAYYENVIDAISNDVKSFVDGYAGKKSLEIVEAIYLSNKLQIPVKFSSY